MFMYGNPSSSWQLCLLSAFPLPLIAVIARVGLGSWLAPGAFFALVWSLLVYLPLLIAPNNDVWPPAVISIVIAVASVGVGSVVGLGGFGAAREIRRPPQAAMPEYLVAARQRRIARTMIYCTGLGSTLGLLGVAVLLTVEGFSVTDLFDPAALASIAREFSIVRYGFDYSPPLTVRILMTCMYVAALCGGVLCVVKSGRWGMVVSFSPFLPAALFMAVLTTRSTVLYVFILWWSAHLSSLVLFKHGKVKLFTRKFWLGVLWVVPLGVAISSVTLMTRYDEEAASLLEFLWPRVRGDVAGHLAAYGEWARSVAGDELKPTFGYFTFAGLFDLLGAQERMSGLYVESVTVGNGEFETGTNLFTVFRGLIQDFGLVGAMVVLFAVGFMSSRAYKSIVDDGSRRAVPALSAFYCFTLWSHVVSFTIYNTMMVAFIVFVATLWCGPSRRHPALAQGCRL